MHTGIRTPRIIHHHHHHHPHTNPLPTNHFPHPQVHSLSPTTRPTHFPLLLTYTYTNATIPTPPSPFLSNPHQSPSPPSIANRNHFPRRRKMSPTPVFPTLLLAHPGLSISLFLF